MSKLQIIVYLNEVTLRNQRRILERIIDIDDALVIDYNQISRTLKFLYGKDSIINFIIY